MAFDFTAFIDSALEEINIREADFNVRRDAAILQKDADFAAAKAEGLTPEQWYRSRCIEPDHTPIPNCKPAGGGTSSPRFKKWGMIAAGVGLLWLLTRKKS
jgi:hypothetical protein